MQMEGRQAAAGRTQSSPSVPYSKEGFLQLSHETTVFVQKPETESARLSATLEDKDVRSPLQPNMLGTKSRVR